MIQNNSGNLRTLIYKNFLIFRTNYKKYLFLYISPILILILMILLQHWMIVNLTFERPNPPIRNLDSIPNCLGQDCVSLAYLVEGKRQPYIDYVINHVKKINNLPDQTVKQWKGIAPHEVSGKLKQAKNKTQFVVVFCTDSYWQVQLPDNRQPIKIPCYSNNYHLNFYTIIYNVTLHHRIPYLSNLQEQYFKDEVTLKLKQDIDEAIIRYYFEKDNQQLYYNISFTEFPSRTSRFVKGFNIVSNYGSFFFIIPYLILFVLEGSMYLKNKQNRLRIGLNIVGVSHLQFYISEFFLYFLHVVMISLVFCSAGYILDMKFWSNGIVWFDFVVLVTNGTILGLLALIVTAMVQEKKLGMTILYSFVLYSIVMQWIFSGGFLFQFLYNRDPNWKVRTMKYIFNLYPSYHFSKIFADVTSIADTHFDNAALRYIEGRPFTYEDLFHARQRQYKVPYPHGFKIPSTFQNCIYMLLTSLVYLIILTFLDIFVQSNRGYKVKCCGKTIQKREVQREIEDDNREKLVQVINLQKTYGNDVHALKGVSFGMKRGEIISLLGQNGAGKSTLINIMVGALSSSQGKVFIDNLDIDTNIKQIRKILGVCPQFDILWQELTAEQHMKIFGVLKQVDNLQVAIQEGLEKVNLWQNRSGIVQTFSGGMKRRLSLAISFLGNPKLIVLDQPTTGMDAKIRIQTWKIILQMRGNQSLLITTHNMEEAQCLSDRIMIMNKGNIVASGTSVELKKQFGIGYIIRGTLKDSKQQILKKCEQENLQQQLEKLQKEGVQNWSIRQTTLQQVFLNAIKHY